MLFERSEFIERFEGFIVPASELRTFSHSFFWFGFLSGDRKKMNKRLRKKGRLNSGRIQDEFLKNSH